MFNSLNITKTIQSKKYKYILLFNLFTLSFLSLTAFTQLYNPTNVVAKQEYSKVNTESIVQLERNTVIETEDTLVTSCGNFSDPLNPFPCCANGANSTWWGAYKRADIKNYMNGTEVASSWWNKTGDLGFPRGQVPQVGAIAAWGNSTSFPEGHVGYVESIIDENTFIVSEMNCNSFPSHTNSHVLTKATHPSFQGFIYKMLRGSTRIEVRDANGNQVSSDINIALASGESFGTNTITGTYTLNNVWAVPARITARSGATTIYRDIVIQPNTQTVNVIYLNSESCVNPQGCVALIPTQVQPTNGITFENTRSVTLDWNDNIGSQFFVEVSGGTEGVRTYGWQYASEISIPVTPGSLEYSWKVRSRNSYGTSEWSPTWTFKVINNEIIAPQPIGCNVPTFNGVIFYTGSNCEGTKLKMNTTEFTKLVAPHNNAIQSIFIKPGWSVKVFANKDKTEGKLCVTSSVSNLNGLTYLDGSSVILNGASTISAIKIYQNSNCNQ
jgi:surface antigen